MKKRKFLNQVMAFLITLSLILSSNMIKPQKAIAEEASKTASQLYVEAMGQGWNLGNSLDGFDGDIDKVDSGETAWGNPVVTKELIKSIKDRGYNSIRIPMTAYRRYSEVDGKYVIDAKWIDRYKEIVNWAVEEGLYVMVNIHHDSWIWLEAWDGNKESEEYKMYVDLWEQLADEFKDYSDKVCFETINEPDFHETDDISAQDKLDMINQVSYETIRNSGGNNATRMIVIPTMYTNHEAQNSKPTYEFIKRLEDENIIATVHYYSEWVFSANLGKTGFDEPLFDWSDEYTARVAAKEMFELLNNTFINNGIGVVVGEWGLLGYDAGNECNQLGEELKYYEYINYLAKKNKVCLMFWDNGSGIDRNDTENYSWKKPLVGKVLQAGIDGQRLSYVTDLNTIYLDKTVEEDLKLNLTLNGNEFIGIENLIEGVDFIYDNESSTVTLLSTYVNSKFNELEGNEYGEIDDLVIQFSAGANWHEYLVKYTKPVLSEATGDVSGFSIPVDFNGTKLRRVTAYNANEDRVGPNSSWWNYLQYNSSFIADYEKNTIEIFEIFFSDDSIEDGEIKFKFEFYDGQVIEYTILKEGSNVTGFGDDSEKLVDEKAIKDVITKINRISNSGKITNKDKEKIEEARSEYNKLLGKEQKLVTNYEKLVSAEKLLASLKK